MRIFLIEERRSPEYVIRLEIPQRRERLIMKVLRQMAEEARGRTERETHTDVVLVGKDFGQDVCLGVHLRDQTGHGVPNFRQPETLV